MSLYELYNGFNCFQFVSFSKPTRGGGGSSRRPLTVLVTRECAGNFWQLDVDTARGTRRGSFCFANVVASTRVEWRCLYRGQWDKMIPECSCLMRWPVVILRSVFMMLWSYEDQQFDTLILS